MASAHVSSGAQSDLTRLERVYLGAVASALRRLAETPRAGRALAGDLEGLRSLRVGMYRIVYRFDPRTDVVEVIWVRHRREVHR